MPQDLRIQVKTRTQKKEKNAVNEEEIINTEQ